MSLGLVPAWLWLGIGAYAVLLVCGDRLLNDTDTYWQISVGQWILDHGALPRMDIYSFTKAGRAMDVIFLAGAGAVCGELYLAGWTGPVVLAAARSLRRSHFSPIFSVVEFLRPMRSW